MSNDLPKGVRVIRGYLQSRITHNGHVDHKHFGLDSPLARTIAEIYVAKKKEEILLGKFGLAAPKEIPSRKFAELVPVYMKLWAVQKDGDGRQKHDERAIRERQRVFDKSLTPFFGAFNFEAIRAVETNKWRLKRLETGILGTSVNREMVPLGDMFSELIKAVAAEQTPAMKVPDINPCKYAEKASMRVRDRIPTDYELKKIKLACKTVMVKDPHGLHDATIGDPDAWEIIKMMLLSVLSEKDLRKLELGSTIDLERAKTGVPVNIPITMLHTLNWKNWRKRWEAIRKEAGCPDIQSRDLRKKGGNHLLEAGFELEKVSDYFGHASIRTTEQSYKIRLSHEKLRPLAEEQKRWVEGL